MQQALCRAGGERHDTCVPVTFVAVADHMRGAAPTPWWHHTVQRKQVCGPV